MNLTPRKKGVEIEGGEGKEVVHGDGEKVDGWVGGEDGGGALGQRSAAEPGTESGDGYRASWAIIGAESSFFSFFFSSLFFQRVILIWERQLVFAARAYLATRGGDAAADGAMHHGAASAHRGVQRRSLGWCKREGWGKGGPEQGEGQDDGGTVREPAEERHGRTRVGHSPTPKSRPTSRPSFPDHTDAYPYRRLARG